MVVAARGINMYEVTAEILRVAERGGAVKIRALRKRKEEITTYLLSQMAGVPADKFFSGCFSPEEWNALRSVSRKLNEMDIYFAEANEPTKEEKVVKVFTI